MESVDSMPKPLPWKTWIKHAMWYLTDGLVCLFPSKHDPDLILLIRLDNIGDFVLWFESAKRIAGSYRRLGKRVVLLAPSAWATWAEGFEIFDQVISLDRSRFVSDLVYRFRMELDIRRFGFETAILCSYSRNWYSGDTIIRTCGSKHRIGSIGDPEFSTSHERRLSRGWYSRLLPASKATLMELERNAEFAGQILEEPALAPKIADLTPHLDASITQRLLHRYGIFGRFYVLFPGASESIKRWPVDNFREIACRLYEQTGWLGVICGGAEDRGLAAELRHTAASPLLDLTGRTDLMQLTQVLSAASFLLSNDTVAVHLAAALRISTVCPLGGGYVGRFLPYSKGAGIPIGPAVVTRQMDCFDCRWVCRFARDTSGAAPCVSEIGVNAVWFETLNLLNRAVAQRTAKVGSRETMQRLPAAV